MFGIDSLELMVIALVALVVIGPKDLPKAMRWVGQWVAKGRAMSRHLRSGFDTMMREAELEEMQNLWAQQNDAIMKATALPDGALPDLSGPVPDAASYDPWPALPPADPQLPALPPADGELSALPPAGDAAIAQPLAAKPKRARNPATPTPGAAKPRARKPVAAGPGEAA